MKKSPIILSLALSLSAGAHGAKPARAALAPEFGKVPLVFEPNVGQTAAEVKFLSRTPRLTLYLAGTETVMALSRSNAAPAVVRMRLKGGDDPYVLGLDRKDSVSHYYLGSDPSRWLSAVPHYGRVEAKGVYPGIDMVYYGDGNRLEYDFVVAPGADPNRIEISFAGIDALRVDPSTGDLIYSTPAGEIANRKPRVYQDVDGRRVEVAGAYRLLSKTSAGFSLGDYDRSRPLTIDPVVVWATYLGGNDEDVAFSVATDSLGSVYVTGQTRSTNFPGTIGNPAGSFDAFVAKFNSAGTALSYSTFIGGTGTDQSFSIAVSSAGEAFIAGSTSSGNFPTTAGVIQGAFGGQNDGFVAKLNPSGVLSLSTYIGGSTLDQANGITIDSGGNIFVVGTTTSVNFVTTNGAFDTQLTGLEDAFVMRLNSTASQRLYSTFLGGGGGDEGLKIALDPQGNAVVCGRTTSSSFDVPPFPTTAGVVQTTFGGATNDGFLTKLNVAGTGLLFSTYLGGSGLDRISDVKVASNGDIYVVGESSSANFPTVPGSFDTSANGGRDIVVARLNSTGTAFLFSTYLGGSGEETGDSLVLAEAAGSVQQVVVVGATASGNYPTVSATQPALLGPSDAVLSKLNINGTALSLSTYLGGTNNETGRGVALSGTDAIVVGQTASVDFPANTFDTSFNQGVLDAFVAKISDGQPSGGLQILQPSPNQVINVAGVTFQWTAVVGATGYDLRIQTLPSGTQIFTGTLLGNGATQTIVTLGNGNYRFLVRNCLNNLFNDANCAPFVSVDFTVALTTPSGAPTITAPANGSTLNISTQTFTWTAVANAGSYEVLLERCNSLTPATCDANISAIEYQITTPGNTTNTIYSMPSGFYRLRVRACQSGCGPYSNAVYFRMLLGPVPTIFPPNFTCAFVAPIGQQGNPLRCQWDPVAGADLYIFQILQPNIGPFANATISSVRTDQTSFTLQMQRGSGFAIVQACNGDGCGPQTPNFNVNATGANPALPVMGTPVAGTNVAGPNLIFTWSKLEGDTGTNTTYRLFALDFARNETAADFLTKDQFYGAFFRAEGARYDALIQVPALGITGPANGFNVSGQSATAPTLVGPRHQTAAVTETIPAGNITLKWTPVPNSAFYQYFVAVQGQPFATVTGLTPGLLVQVPLTANPTPYSGIVRACPVANAGICSLNSDAGWGPWSNQAGPGVTNFIVQ